MMSGLELCRAITGQKGNEAPDVCAQELIRGFEDCSSLRIEEPEHVQIMVVAAEFCLKADIDHACGMRAARQFLA